MSKSNYEQVKEWRKRNPEKVAAQARRYNAKHPDKRKEIRERHRAKNLNKIRERDRIAQAKRRNDPIAQKKRNEHYAIRQEAKRWELAARPRADICDICSSDKIIVFDHCHKINKFRGWICDRCNKMLGLVKDSPDLLKKLAVYLENFNEQINNQSTKCAS